MSFRCCLVALVLGCSSESASVRVDVRTDLVAGVEFTHATVTVTGSEERSISVQRVGEDWLDAARMVRFGEVESGATQVTVRLQQFQNIVASRSVLASVEGPTAVSVLLTRSCVGVECDEDESCLDAQCMPQGCISGEEEVCGSINRCESAADCEMRASVCAEPTCRDGNCLSVVNPSLCDAGEICNGIACVPDLQDCATAADCETNLECGQAFCEGGRCQVRPDDAACESGEICHASLGCIQVVTPCMSNTECDDSDPCTSDLCTAGICQHEIDIASCVASECQSVTEIPLLECDALVRLYLATDGASWRRQDGWLANATPCSWVGVTCSDGHVTRLDVSDNGLRGQVPTELEQLTFLIELELYDNGLDGALPVEITSLIRLRNLDLAGNQLSGTLPPEIGRLTSLRTLFLNSNAFDGPLPDTVGDLIVLETFMLQSNAFSGELPSTMASLDRLRFLGVSTNRFTGDLTLFTQMTGLSGLYLEGNNFDGPIPPEIRNLIRMTELSLTGNAFTGPLPPELGELTSLRDLRLSSNGFTGPVPRELQNLPSLDVMWLHDNELEGVVPDGFQNGPITTLSLGGNRCLTAETPALATWLSTLAPQWADGC